MSAVIAQLGERLTEDLKVPCSIHGYGIFFALKSNKSPYGPMDKASRRFRVRVPGMGYFFCCRDTKISRIDIITNDSNKNLVDTSYNPKKYD